MTNEECIKILKSKLDGNTDTSYEWCECVRLAIKALEQPSYKSDARRWKRRYLDLKQRIIKLEEQQPCEDAISRKEALECARLITDDEGIMHEVIHVDDINDLPTMKPKAEPCDTISRQAVIDYIKGHIHEIISASGRDLNEHTNQVLRAVIKGVEVLPRKRGLTGAKRN